MAGMAQHGTAQGPSSLPLGERDSHGCSETKMSWLQELGVEKPRETAARRQPLIPPAM